MQTYAFLQLNCIWFCFKKLISYSIECFRFFNNSPSAVTTWIYSVATAVIIYMLQCLSSESLHHKYLLLALAHNAYWDSKSAFASPATIAIQVEGRKVLISRNMSWNMKPLHDETGTSYLWHLFLINLTIRKPPPRLQYLFCTEKCFSLLLMMH